MNTNLVLALQQAGHQSRSMMQNQFFWGALRADTSQKIIFHFSGTGGPPAKKRKLNERGTKHHEISRPLMRRVDKVSDEMGNDRLVRQGWRSGKVCAPSSQLVGTSWATPQNQSDQLGFPQMSTNGNLYFLIKGVVDPEIHRGLSVYCPSQISIKSQWNYKEIDPGIHRRLSVYIPFQISIKGSKKQTRVSMEDLLFISLLTHPLKA